MLTDNLVKSKVFAKNRSELKYNLMWWKEALKKRHMNINMKKKPKIVILGGEEGVEMKLKGIRLDQVESFKYLGVQIQNNGKQKPEINEGIDTAIKIKDILHAEHKLSKGESNYREDQNKCV